MRKKLDVQAEQARKHRKQRWRTAMVVLLILAAGLSVLLLFRQDFLSSRSGPNRPQLSRTAQTTSPPETMSPTEPPTTAPPETTEPPAPSIQEQAQAILDTMRLEEKVFQLFLVRPEAIVQVPSVTEAPADLPVLLTGMPVGGIALFGDNLVARDQTSALIQAFQDSSPLPLFIGVDEEGGTVSRLGSNAAMGVPHFPTARDLGKNKDPDGVYQMGRTLGEELMALGFNLNFAPVADVDTNPNNPVIGSRAFSSDPVIAAELAAAAVWGFQDTGVISCLKHFPGHGDTSSDTHYGYAETTKTLEALRQTELLPFQAGIEAGAPMVMAAHIACPNVTGNERPASLSSAIITDLLRQELGFDGVVITDSLEMDAISALYPQGEAAVMALEAGCDLLLLPQNLPQATEAIFAALDSGRLTEQRLEESVLRILKLKLEYGIIPAP